MSKKARKSTPIDTTLTLTEHAKGLYLRLVSLVDAKINTGDVSTSLLREVAGVMRAAAALDAEQRAREKADRQQMEAMRPDDIIEWARKQDAAVRQGLTRELLQLESKRSGLA